MTKYRAYNPGLGRWLSREPKVNNGMTNLYAYVNNNPIGYFDPYGQDALGAAWGGAIGAGFGGFAGASGGTLVVPGVGTIAGGYEGSIFGAGVGTAIGSAVPGQQIQKRFEEAARGIMQMSAELEDKWDRWAVCVSKLRIALKDCSKCKNDQAKIQCEKEAWQSYEDCLTTIAPRPEGL